MFTLSTYSLCTIVKGLSSPFFHFLNISQVARIIGAIGGLNLMKIAISANPKLRLIPNKTSPPMMPPAPPSVPMMPPAPPSVPMMPPAPPSVPTDGGAER